MLFVKEIHLGGKKMKMNDEVCEMIQNPRRFTTATVLENLMESDDFKDGDMPLEEGLKVTCLESIAINLAELTDRVNELAAYMQRFAGPGREQKESK
jgi:hypothetical protein